MTIKKKIRLSPDADDGQSRVRLTEARLWLFDMDDTLFDASAGMFASIHRRMESFIAEKLDLSVEDAARVQNDYWSKYGATFLGLELHDNIAPQEFFDATHRFDLKPFVRMHKGSENLRRLLARLPGKKAVVTNGPAIYAHGVIRAMGLEGVFDGVVSANDMRRLGQWRCKPDALLIESICAQFKTTPRHTVMVEDSPANLKVAKSLGLSAVWCAGYRKKPPVPTRAHMWADFVINDIAHLVRIFERAQTTRKESLIATK